VDTPVGKAFVTINQNGGEQPFEVFINTAKAGSETAAVSEAIGRLISYVLRLVSPVAPRDRLREVVRQLNGIGGGRPLGFGPNRVRSLPDGVGQVLDEYLRERDGAQSARANGGHPEEAADESTEWPVEIPSELQAEELDLPMTLAPGANGGVRGLPRIGDLCPECGEAAVISEEGCRKCYNCGYSEC
jgi:ribonucleoside-diphosphate reductase alpha chain